MGWIISRGVCVCERVGVESVPPGCGGQNTHHRHHRRHSSLHHHTPTGRQAGRPLLPPCLPPSHPPWPGHEANDLVTTAEAWHAATHHTHVLPIPMILTLPLHTRTCTLDKPTYKGRLHSPTQGFRKLTHQNKASRTKTNACMVSSSLFPGIKSPTSFPLRLFCKGT